MLRLFRMLLPLLLAAATVAPTAAQQQAVEVSRLIVEIRGNIYSVHDVRRGETLYAIAKAYGVTEEAILAANSLTSTAVKRGQTLLVPKRTAGVDPAPPAGQTQGDGPGRQPLAESEGQSGSQQTAAGGRFPFIDTLSAASPQGVARRMRPYSPPAPARVVVLLPMSGQGRENFVDFYKGMLVGLDALKSRGIPVNVRVVDLAQSADRARELIRDGIFEQANLIVGPVYPESFGVVASYAASQGIPIVNPLGAVEGPEVDNSFVFEMAPVERTKYEALVASALEADKNIVLINHLQQADRASFEQLRTSLGSRAAVMNYSGDRAQDKAMTAQLASLLDRERDNVVFVPVGQEPAVESVLSRLSSINTLNRYRITVVGTSRWGWFSNINLELFFKLNVHFPASYFADRNNPLVGEFYREYVTAFGSVPSLYSFRGSDVIRYFVGILTRYDTRMLDRAPSYQPELLQVRYHFLSAAPGGHFENCRWPIVNYQPDFTVVVK